MTTIRPAAVAGSFYPDDAATLRETVQALLAAAPTTSITPKLLIAPHAGYVYSGPVAATGYTLLPAIAANIRRVVLLGPAHRVYFQGVAVSTAQAFATPIGTVPTATTAVAELRQTGQVIEHDEAHADEHSLEVHLPFLQLTLNDFELIPLLVGDADHREVAALIDSLWGGEETLIVISTDLSHFLDYEAACRADAQTTRLIERAEPHVASEQACGCRPLNAALEVIPARGLNVQTLDVRNSGDTAGPRGRVVGYGTYVAT